MRDGGELTPGRANLREERLSDGRREPGDGYEIEARDAVQEGARRIAGLVLRGRIRLDPRHRTERLLTLKTRRHHHALPCDLGLTRGQGGVSKSPRAQAGGSIHHC